MPRSRAEHRPPKHHPQNTAPQGTALVKCVLCFVNFLTMLCGVALFCVGIWTYLFRNYMEKFFGSPLYGITDYIIIATGAAITFLSFLGCCGAKNEIKWMLVLYFCILFILCLMIVSAGTMAFLFTSKLSESMHKEMKRSIPLYGLKRQITTAWDNVQEHLKCCGIKEGSNDSYTIWERDNEFFKEKTKIVPDSCCKQKDVESIKACNADPKTHTNNRDCFHEVEIFAKDNALILGGLGFAVAVVLIIGMILSCLLLRLLD